MDQEAALTGAGLDTLDMMAAFGKTAVSLIIVLALIYGLSLLLKMLRNPVRSGTPLLKQVTSTAVGPRERVVVLELDKTWLVVGVGGGQVTLLKEMPAPELPPAANNGTGADTFARRLHALIGKAPAENKSQDHPS